MGANLTLCCCHFFVKYNREKKKSLLRMNSGQTSNTTKTLKELSGESSDTEEENQFGQELTSRSPRTTAQNQGTNKYVSSPRRRESNRELQAFISMRNQVDQATEEWEQLNFDIHTLCYAKREVRARWRKILLQLGYQSEVDALLYVNKQNYVNRDQESLTTATALLTQLLENSCLFPPGTGHRTRYLYVMDRLVSLDSAEEFVNLAMEKYPKA
ncbi:melanoregulin [Stigmatopora nigra]